MMKTDLSVHSHVYAKYECFLVNDFRDVTWSLDPRPRVRDQGHESGVTVTGHGSQVRGQEAQVKDHASRIRGQGSEVRITGQRSRVTGQESLVKGHWSGVTGQSQWSVVKGQWSRVTGQNIFYLRTLYESDPAEGLEEIIF